LTLCDAGVAEGSPPPPLGPEPAWEQGRPPFEKLPIVTERLTHHAVNLLKYHNLTPDDDTTPLGH